MNIGSIKPNDGGFLIGKIETLAFAMVIGLRELHSENPNAPRYEVYGKAASGAWVKVGALWEQVSNSSGEAFLQGQLNDPSMAKPLSIACFRQEDGSYNIAWTQPRTRRDMPANQTPAAADDAGFPFPADDVPGEPAKGRRSKAREGLGESTSDHATA